jgi:hypothetical protein
MLKLFQKTKNNLIKNIRDYINDSGDPDEYISRRQDRLSELMKALDSMVELASELDQKMRQLKRHSISFEDYFYLSQKFDNLHDITYGVLKIYHNLFGITHSRSEQLIDLRCAIMDYAKEFEKEKTSEEILECVQYYLAGKNHYGGSINDGGFS